MSENMPPTWSPSSSTHGFTEIALADVSPRDRLILVIRPAAALAIAGLSLLGLVGCSGGRSVAAFCEVHDTHQERYQTSMSQAIESFEDDPLGAVAQGGAAIGDLANMWHELAAVAPEEIQADVERVAELMDAQVGADVPAVVQNYLMLQGPVQRVDAFIVENC